MKRPLLCAFTLCSSLLLAEGEAGYCIEDVNSSLTLKYREGDGIGYEGGYGTAELLWTPQGFNTFQYFVDLRAHRLQEKGKFAANGGLGLRYSSGTCCPIFGANVYYDYRDDKRLPSHQVGLGLETFFEYADIRVNGYLPIGDKVDKSGPHFVSFSGNNINFESSYVASLPRVEAEVGGFIPGPFSWVDLYVGLGGYYLFQRKSHHQKFGDAFGGEARISVKPFDGLTVGVDYSYDSIFKSRVQGVIAYSFPTGPATLKRRGKAFQCAYETCECRLEMYHVAKMVAPPQRAEIIPLEHKTRHFDQNLLTQGGSSSGLGPTGSILSRINAIFVDPSLNTPLLRSALGPGSGTYEDPYISLPLALNHSQNGDIIYVFANGGISTAISDPITLLDDQRLIGSGVSFNYFGIPIPPSPGDAGNYVYLQPTSGTAIVTPGLNNEIAGFAFVISAGSENMQTGITTPTSVGTLTIRNCIFQTNSASLNTGILINVLGANTITLQNNQFNNLQTGVSYTFTDTGIVNSLTATGNVFSNNPLSMNLVSSCTGSDPAINHLFDLEQNDFGTGLFALTRQESTIASNVNGINVTFINNNISSNSYFFTNSGVGLGSGAITITILPNQPEDQSGISSSNNGGDVSISQTSTTPIEIVSP